MRTVNCALSLTCLLLSPVRAQEPLSAIDWLRAPLPAIKAGPAAPVETGPPVAPSALSPDVTVTPLGPVNPAAAGLLPESMTGLPPSLWHGDDTGTLIATLKRLPSRPLPALQAMIYTVLLAEADPPAGDRGADFLLARARALMDYGAVYQTYALLERAGPLDPDLFDLYFDAALLLADTETACATQQSGSIHARDHARRIFCSARAGDWETAALTYESAAALNLLSEDDEFLLAIYLDPELAEGDLPDPVPARMTPLTYRLWESAGKRVPSTRLPVAYSVADLDEVAGWRLQLEAAERLARRGALGGNHLLGLYTSQKAAASGGLWDRVSAVQRLDLAVKRQDPASLSPALERAWPVMRDVGLQPFLADVFAEQAAGISPRDAQVLRLGLLSPAYDRLALAAQPVTGELSFAVSVALGTPAAEAVRTPLDEAVLAAFSEIPGPDPDRKSLGRGILEAARLLTDAGQDTGMIRTGLARLRALGLEDTARRTALQLLLLPPAR